MSSIKAHEIEAVVTSKMSQEPLEYLSVGREQVPEQEWAGSSLSANEVRETKMEG